MRALEGPVVGIRGRRASSIIVDRGIRRELDRCAKSGVVFNAVISLSRR